LEIYITYERTRPRAANFEIIIRERDASIAPSSLKASIAIRRPAAVDETGVPAAAVAVIVGGRDTRRRTKEVHGDVVCSHSSPSLPRNVLPPERDLRLEGVPFSVAKVHSNRSTTEAKALQVSRTPPDHPCQETTWDCGAPCKIVRSKDERSNTIAPTARAVLCRFRTRYTTASRSVRQTRRRTRALRTCETTILCGVGDVARDQRSAKASCPLNAALSRRRRVLA